MPSRRAVLGVLASALLSGCAGNLGATLDTGRRTDGGPATDGEADAGGDGSRETAFDRPAVTTPGAGACSPASRPPAVDGAPYPSHPGDVAELSVYQFARAYETALARSRVAATAAASVAADPVETALQLPESDEWYVAAVTVERTVRADGEEETERVGGTYFLTDEVAMRADGAARMDGDAAARLSDAVVVACP